MKQIEILQDDANQRLDKFLLKMFPDLSRSLMYKAIRNKKIKVNRKRCTYDQILNKGDIVLLFLPPQFLNEKQRESNFISNQLDVIYEDDDILVVNKPAGLVVHPAAGHWDDTLLNGLLARNPELKTLPRAGIVHRLDRDTTGLMVVAKTLEAQTDLIRQLQARTVKREYWAIVHGQAPQAGFIDEPIMRDPRSPIRFCVGQGPRAKEAKTHVRLVDFAYVPGVGQTPLSVSWVACRLDTGRTHQIRVHMEYIKHPCVGDPVYGWQKKDNLGLERQFLHSYKLAFTHPVTGERMEFEDSLPADLQEVIAGLEERE